MIRRITSCVLVLTLVWVVGTAQSPRPTMPVGQILGVGVPAMNCYVGQHYFRTDAAAGSNTYLCTALPNVWTQSSTAPISYLFSATADATNAAAAEATVIGAGSGSLTLAANYFGTAGNPLIVSASGHYSTPAVPGTLRIRLKIGAATVLDTGAFTPQPALVQQVWTLEARIVSRAVGAGGTVMVQSQFHPGAGAPVGQDWPLLNTAAVALNTTLANAVDLTAEWSAAGGETVTGTNFLMYGVTGASIPTPVGYATIQQATVPLTQRQTVNFTGAGVACVDNAGATRTDCTVAGSTQILPTRAEMWHKDSIVTTGNAIVNNFNTSQMYSSFSAQTAAQNGDTFTQSFMLAAGTYTLVFFGITSTDRGKIDWYIDDVKVVSLQDWYATPAAFNITKTVTSISVVGNGRHVLKGVVNGKNGSSSAYIMVLTRIDVIPASDVASV